MNFLHKFLHQPCFDNAGGGGASGGGGNTRGTMKGDTGMDSVGNFSGGFGQNAVSGVARSGAGSREGYGYGAAGAVGRNQPARGSGLAARSAAPPRATVTVAPPVRSYAPPPVTVAPPPTPAVAPPTAMPTAPAAPVSMAPNAYGPNAIGSAPMSNSQVASLAASNAASAPVAAAPSRSMSPATRSTPAQAAAARSVGAQAAAQRAAGAVSATPGGGISGVNSIGGMNGGSMAALGMDRGIPSVSGGSSTQNKSPSPSSSFSKGFQSDQISRPGMTSPSSRGGIADAVRAVGARSAPSAGGISGVNSIGGMNGGSMAALGMDRSPSRSVGGVSGVNSIGGLNGGSMAALGLGAARSAPTQSAGAMPAGISDLTDAQMSGVIGDIVSGRPSQQFGGLSPLGSFATNQPSVNDMLASDLMQGLPSARGYSQPTMSATPTTGAKAITDRLSVASQGPTPSLQSRAVNEMVKLGVPSMRDQNFYSSDNAYEGVNFPSVNDAYPTSAAALPGGYSSTPQGSWSRNAPSFDTPMEAAQNMGIMDQMRALNMFTRGSVAPSRNDGTNRGGNSKSNTKERNRAKKAIAEAIAPKKSGWSPYTGSSRFANWTPIMKALIG